MLKYNYQEYEIEIFDDSPFSKKSSDNLHKYDLEYGENSHTNATSKHGIKILRNKETIKSALLLSYSGASGIHKNSTIIDDDHLIICVGNNLFCLELPQLKLLWTIQADSATCFEVFKVESFYIVHGEVEISRISKDGKIEWQFSGKDIFTTPKGVDDFMIKNDHIIVKDWDKDVYKIDFNGKGFIL